MFSRLCRLGLLPECCQEGFPCCVAEWQLWAVDRVGVTYEDAAATLADFDAGTTVAPAATGLTPLRI
jgi:hypothetical protein